MLRKISLIVAFCLWSATAHATIAVDGSSISGSSCTSTPCTISVTNTNAGDFCHLFMKNIQSGGTSALISSISDSSSATWTKQAQFIGSNSAGGIAANSDNEEWTAPITGSGANTITVHFGSGSLNVRLIPVCVSGYNISIPRDTNGSLPAVATLNSLSATTLAVTPSTSNANDIIFSMLSCGNSGGTAGTGACNSYSVPSGFTLLQSDASNMGLAYEIVSSTLSSASTAWTYTAGSNSQNTIVDADQQASGGGGGGTSHPSFFGGFP
jgi:hypothetical protein